MDNPFAMVVAIILIVTIGRVFTARYRHEKRDSDDTFGPVSAASAIETQRLRDELKAMKERLAVLERLATDTNDSGARLDREIERLRDRS
ncbi:hypothetical protein ACFOKI_14345 [Sphingomonas qilianensis]|uniref:Phage shock protein B n=1 Tax=Sphingomonas qilianensis TaxID=1736690 RepID=A0ABU9XNE5_9SPHN